MNDIGISAIVHPEADHVSIMTSGRGDVWLDLKGEHYNGISILLKDGVAQAIVDALKPYVETGQ